MLFGGICRDPNPDEDCLYRPYLEITDPTDRTYSTRLELDQSIFQHASKHSTPHIRVRSGAGHEKGSLEEKEGIAFVSDASRGVICAEVSRCATHSQQVQDFQSSVFVLDIQGLLSKIPSSSDFKQRHIQWKDLSPSAAIFCYDSQQIAPHRLLMKYQYVAGFRYISPIHPLSPASSMDSRYFFVYDFNPHREAPASLPSASPEAPDPETGYQKSASEITREVVGGLSRWKMRFDLPPVKVDIEECHVALTDGGVVLFEVRFLTIFSQWFDGNPCPLKVVLFRRGVHYGFLDLVIRWFVGFHGKLMGNIFRTFEDTTLSSSRSSANIFRICSKSLLTSGITWGDCGLQGGALSSVGVNALFTTGQFIPTWY